MLAICVDFHMNFVGAVFLRVTLLTPLTLAFVFDQAPQRAQESYPWLSLKFRALSQYGVIAHVASRDKRYEASLELHGGRLMVAFELELYGNEIDFSSTMVALV